MNDDKVAKDYNIEGGSVLHLVRHLSAPYILHAAVCVILTHQSQLVAAVAEFALPWTRRCSLCEGGLPLDTAAGQPAIGIRVFSESGAFASQLWGARTGS